jgi:hypothetical protein
MLFRNSTEGKTCRRYNRSVRKMSRGFSNELFEDDEHAKRVRSLANATLGVMTGASLAVHTIGNLRSTLGIACCTAA